jgi:hypothetical protein
VGTGIPAWGASHAAHELSAALSLTLSSVDAQAILTAHEHEARVVFEGIAELEAPIDA